MGHLKRVATKSFIVACKIKSIKQYSDVKVI